MSGYDARAAPATPTRPRAAGQSYRSLRLRGRTSARCCGMPQRSAPAASRLQRRILEITAGDAYGNTGFGRKERAILER